MLFLKVFSITVLYCWCFFCYSLLPLLEGVVWQCWGISSPVATIGQKRNSPVRESSLSLLLILYSVVYLRKRGGGSLVVQSLYRLSLSKLPRRWQQYADTFSFSSGKFGTKFRKSHLLSESMLLLLLLLLLTLILSFATLKKAHILSIF